MDDRELGERLTRIENNTIIINEQLQALIEAIVGQTKEKNETKEPPKPKKTETKENNVEKAIKIRDKNME